MKPEAFIIALAFLVLFAISAGAIRKAIDRQTSAIHDLIRVIQVK